MAQQPVRPIRPPVAAPARKPTDTRDRWRARREATQAEAGPYAGAETRERWYQEQTPLWLHKVSYFQNGSFGAHWRLELSENDPREKVVYLTLRDNSWRNMFFAGVAADFEADPTPIGPLCLTKVDTGGVNPAWDLEEWSEEDAG